MPTRDQTVPGVVFTCPCCHEPFAKVQGVEMDIHSGATYQCARCGGAVVFCALTTDEYVAHCAATAGKH